MPEPLPHPLAAIFPDLPPEELRQLAKDISQRGQIEPIILYRGQILDGRNRYKACQMAGVTPRFKEFSAVKAERSPEEFVLSRNLRRRHLSVGQKAAIALEWADQLESRPKSDKNKRTGRPRGAVLEAAEHIGIDRQRIFEARLIRKANQSLYQELKAGKCSIHSALMEVTAQEPQPGKSGAGRPSAASRKLNGDEEERGLIQRRGTRAAPELQKPSNSGASAFVKASPPPPSAAALKKALNRIKEKFGTSFHAEVKAGNVFEKPEETVRFSKLDDAPMREIGSLLRKGWVFAAAYREIVERLSPGDEIRALHSRTIENGGTWYLVSVGDFGHVVVRGGQKDKILAQFKEILINRRPYLRD